MIVVADTDSTGVTHNLKLYGLDGRLVNTFPLTPDVWPLAAAGKRIFVQKSNRLEAIDRTGAVQDLGPLAVAPNEIAFIVPSPDGTHWLHAISGTIHEAGDGMSDRAVATGTSTSPLQVYAWTPTAALIIHLPPYSFDIPGPSPIEPRWYIGSVDTLDVASGFLKPVGGSAQCKPGDVSARGVYACFVPQPKDPTAATRLLRLMPSAGQPIEVPLAQPLFTEAGDAWFSPSGDFLTLAGWDGSGPIYPPASASRTAGLGIHTYLVDRAGTITPFGPAGAEPVLNAQTWLPEGNKLLLERKVGSRGGDPGLFILDPNGNGPFIRDSSRPIGVIS